MAEKGASSERRVAERLPLALKVRLIADGEELAGRSVNISKTGMFVEVDQVRPLGSPVRLALTIPGPEPRPVQMDGRVARRVTQEEARRNGSVPGLGIEYTSFRCGQADLFEDLNRRLGKSDPSKTPVPTGGRRTQQGMRGGVPVAWGLRSRTDRTGRLLWLEDSKAYIGAEQPEPPGSHLYLGFELSLHGLRQNVRVIGHVVRNESMDLPAQESRPAGMVVAFDQATSDLQNLLQALERELVRIRQQEHAVERARELPEPPRTPTPAPAAAQPPAAPETAPPAAEPGLQDPEQTLSSRAQIEALTQLDNSPGEGDLWSERVRDASGAPINAAQASRKALDSTVDLPTLLNQTLKAADSKAQSKPVQKDRPDLRPLLQRLREEPALLVAIVLFGYLFARLLGLLLF